MMDNFAQVLTPDTLALRIKIAQQEAITELVLENQKLKRERDEAREKYTTFLTENMLAVQKLCTERDAERESARRWRKLASAYEISCRLWAGSAL